MEPRSDKSRPAIRDRVVSRSQRELRAIFMAILLVTLPAAADSIRVDGTEHTGVYVVPSTELYIVLNPADGSSFVVRKKDVSMGALELTRDKDERDALYESWKEKSSLKDSSGGASEGIDSFRDRLTRNYAIREQAASKTLTLEHKGAPMLTNRGSKMARRPSFVDRNGVPNLTNRPSKFRNNAEYVEVNIQYEMIQIPERFRARYSSPKPLLNTDYKDLVGYYAQQYNVPASLIFAIIQTESAGNPHAVSRAGARGLMQLMPGTAAEMGVTDIFDPAQNIAGGTQYLAKLLKLYKGNKSYALAGYNAGPGAVKKHGGIPPYKETQNYVRKVQLLERQYARIGNPTFVVKDVAPVSDAFLPGDKPEFTHILLTNGLRLPADTVEDKGEHYLYTFEEKTQQVKKEFVKEIIEPK